MKTKTYNIGLSDGIAGWIDVSGQRDRRRADMSWKGKVINKRPAIKNL